MPSMRLLLFYGIPFVLALFCVIHAIMSDEGSIRFLPKALWILLILSFPVIGSVAWLVAGQPVPDRPRRNERAVPHYPEYDRPGRTAATNPEADDAFLADVRRRAEEQRQRYAAQQREKAKQEERDAARRRQKQTPPDETPEG